MESYFDPPFSGSALIVLKNPTMSLMSCCIAISSTLFSFQKSIKIVEEVLNVFNKEIINALKNNGCDSEGITNKKNNILTVKQENLSLGFVGSPKEIKQSIIEQIICKKCIFY